MVVRGEERLRLHLRVLVQVLGHAPRDRDAVERGGAAADLVEHDERARRRVVEDVRRLLHLHEERGASAREVVARADAREHAVERAEAHRGGRHEAARLRHDGDRRDLADVGGLAGHVGPGDEHDLVGRAVEARGVRHERLGIRQLLDDRVASVRDLEHVRVVDGRPHVARGERAVGEGEDRVEFAHGGGGLLDGRRARRDLGDDLAEEILLERVRPLLRAQHLALVFLQLGRGEALGVRQSLAPLVLGRRAGRGSF